MILLSEGLVQETGDGRGGSEDQQECIPYHKM